MSKPDNPINGTDFQKKVQGWFQNQYESTFRLEEKIRIGNPPTDHKFDIVSPEKMIAVECKRYTILTMNSGRKRWQDITTGDTDIFLAILLWRNTTKKQMA